MGAWFLNGILSAAPNWSQSRNAGEAFARFRNPPRMWTIGGFPNLTKVMLGKIEGLIGYARRNFLVPIPHFESFAALGFW